MLILEPGMNLKEADFIDDELPQYFDMVKSVRTELAKQKQIPHIKDNNAKVNKNK